MSNQNQQAAPPSPQTSLKDRMRDIREENQNQNNAPQAPAAPQPSAPVVPPTAPKTISVSNPAAPQAPAAPSSPEAQQAANGINLPQEKQTYIELGDENNGFIEYDLQSFRQKGEEQRYLSITMTGIIREAHTGGENSQLVPEAQNTIGVNTMNVSSREQFEQLKHFFANLEWED